MALLGGSEGMPPGYLSNFLYLILAASYSSIFKNCKAEIIVEMKKITNA